MGFLNQVITFGGHHLEGMEGDSGNGVEPAGWTVWAMAMIVAYCNEPPLHCRIRWWRRSKIPSPKKQSCASQVIIFLQLLDTHDPNLNHKFINSPKPRFHNYNLTLEEILLWLRNALGVCPQHAPKWQRLPQRPLYIYIYTDRNLPVE